jgi:hypothetical protein
MACLRIEFAIDFAGHRLKRSAVELQHLLSLAKRRISVTWTADMNFHTTLCLEVNETHS